MTKTHILLIIGACLGIAAIFWLAQDTPEPTQGGPLVDITIPTPLTDAATIGKRAFDAKCAACHGTNAAGNDGSGPPLVHRIYEPNHHGDAAFVRAAQNGVPSHHWPFGNMPPVGGITRAEVLSVVDYIRELQRANGI